METEPGQDEAAIRAIVQRVQDGWNAGDGTAFAASFAEDADYIIIDGRAIQGRAVIAGGHQQIFATIYRGSHNTFTVEAIRFLRPDVALAHVTSQLETAQGAGEARSTWVCTKENGVWQIVAFQNTAISLPGKAREKSGGQVHGN